MAYSPIALEPTREDYQHVIDLQAKEITDSSLKLAILTRERQELAQRVEQLTPSVMGLQAQVDQLEATNGKLIEQLAAKKPKQKNDASAITES